MVLSSTEEKHMRQPREPEDSGNVGSAKPLVNGVIVHVNETTGVSES